MSTNIENLLKERSGIRLDIGCGGNKTPGFVGMDLRSLDGVDIVHDVESYPWPLPDESVLCAVASHLVEHIMPARFGFINFMNEVWRVLKVGGEFAIATPHGYSPGYLQDPTHCFSDDTEILTRDGFKLISEVEIGESLVVMNPETQAIEYSPCVHHIHMPYKGPMVHFRHKRMDVLVTPNHDIYFGNSGSSTNWRIAQADNFLGKSNRSRIGKATIQWTGENPLTLGVPRATQTNGKLGPVEFDAKQFMRFMGWYLSEGCVYLDKSNYTVIIYQSSEVNPGKYDEILYLLQNMGFGVTARKDSIRLSSKSLFEYLSVLGDSRTKYIPSSLKNLHPELLRHMLDTLLLGDGRKNGDGWEYATISARLATDVQEIALKCGYRSQMRVERRKLQAMIRGNAVNQSQEIYMVGISPDANLYYASPKLVEYDGHIACVTSEKHHIVMVRRNGKVLWSGNCNPCNEATWAYFDPFEPNTGGLLWRIYRPLPYRIKFLSWSPDANIEVVLVKRALSEVANV